MAEYIEREAAIIDLELYEKTVYKNEYALAIAACRSHIRKIPAADVAPVRHGRWTREKNWETGYGMWVNVCSVCGAITPVNVSRYRYCPNCGAKMDGET